MSKKHVVTQGESLASIAAQHGFLRWETIYHHADNADFRRKRPNPNVLYPGDELTIPEKGQTPRATAVKHRETVTFKVKRGVSWLRIRVDGYDGKPLKSKLYTLVVDGRRILGTTTSTGMVEHKVPAGATEGELTVWLAKGKREGPHHTWTLKIGHLDPADTVEGAQARLNNLGYPAGPVDGVLGPRTQRALEAFQAAKKLPITGALDDATRKALEQHHEGP